MQPIHPTDSSGPISTTQTPQERQKTFEIQFATAVLGNFVAITQQNSSIQSQISKLKSGLASGQSPDQLATSLNQLISQINNGIVPGKPHFPYFSFSSEGSQVQALRNFSLSLEKFLNTAAEKGSLNWNDEQKLFGELSYLVNNIGQMTPEQAFDKLNGVIEAANNHLPQKYQLPTIPLMQRR